MNYNYHTHTYRCGHADGTDEEYIQNAISCGIKHMGFSDHIPIKLPNPENNDFVVYEGIIADYCRDIAVLKDKYKDLIDIKIGFETEYSSKHFGKIRDVCKEYNVDYLICGQHFIKTKHSGYVYSSIENNRICDLKTYVSTVVSAMNEGDFTYIAHPDMFNFAGDSSVYDEEMRKICVSSRKLNIPLEINFMGIRGNRIYPKDSFWRIAGEEKSPIVFGIDAHSPGDSYDEKSLKRATELLEKYHLNILKTF